MSSEDGTQAGFSDEEDEDFEVADDEESVVEDTFFEETVNSLFAREGENKYNLGTHASSSGGEDKNLDLDADDGSIVQDTIFEKYSTVNSTREGENTIINSHVGVKEKTSMPSDHETREGKDPRLSSDHNMREGEKPEVKSATTREGENTKVKDGTDGPNMSEEKHSEVVGDRK
ncbi:hypothetical protein L2E82_40225 [Cichorium intybus]|uniref:Uncharacterized protein n=1 Tax=Cichorium intybus TaxID=13427 RepID=A0ACB9AJP0_CICIN|nr:hypothetical protein L2E82_40225 [Cichorium intybus]